MMLYHIAMMIYHGFYHLYPAVVIWQTYLLLVCKYLQYIVLFFSMLTFIHSVSNLRG